ncbi:MAG TPA: hypothetical protein VGL61_04085 [Kofleriaceae bacterium]
MTCALHIGGSGPSFGTGGSGVPASGVALTLVALVPSIGVDGFGVLGDGGTVGSLFRPHAASAQANNMIARVFMLADSAAEVPIGVSLAGSRLARSTRYEDA